MENISSYSGRFSNSSQASSTDIASSKSGMTRASGSHSDLSRTARIISNAPPLSCATSYSGPHSYRAALRDAVSLSENRIKFANPNSLAQFIKEKGAGSVDAYAPKSVLARTTVKKDFKNSELFSNYNTSGWVLKSDLKAGETINSKLFGEPLAGTKYYLDCSEYVQAIQLYAVYNSSGSKERKERFDDKDQFSIGSFESTGIRSKTTITKRNPDDSFTVNTSRKSIEMSDRELFDYVPIGSRIAFTNRESSANNTDFKNENTIKISDSEVAALGFESRTYSYDDLKFRLAWDDKLLRKKLYSENSDWTFPKSVREISNEQKKEFSKHTFISEVAIYDTPESKDFNP